MPKPRKRAVAARNPDAPRAVGACLCGAVEIEVDVPAVWAWHDHSTQTQRAQGAAYATYIGCWKSKVRVVRGEKLITQFGFDDERRRRSFCARCGTPLMYERSHSPKMVNLPRALFASRTGREPRYHVGFESIPEWAYRGEPLSPLKGYPGVLQSRARKKPPKGDWE